MKLWIGNLDPKTTDDDLRSRPAVMLELEGGDIVALDAAQRRLHGMYYKNRPLHVAIPSR